MASARPTRPARQGQEQRVGVDRVIELVLIGLDHRVEDIRQELVQPTCFPCVLPHPRERDIELARVAEQITQSRQRERGDRMEPQHLSQITRGQEGRSRPLGVTRQLPA